MKIFAASFCTFQDYSEVVETWWRPFPDVSGPIRPDSFRAPYFQDCGTAKFPKLACDWSSYTRGSKNCKMVSSTGHAGGWDTPPGSRPRVGPGPT